MGGVEYPFNYSFIYQNCKYVFWLNLPTNGGVEGGLGGGLVGMDVTPTPRMNDPGGELSPEK
jgi:hypothetical protein